MLKTTKPLLQTISIDDKTAKQIYNIIDALFTKNAVFLIDSKGGRQSITAILKNFPVVEINYKERIGLENPEHIKQFKAIGYYI